MCGIVGYTGYRSAKDVLLSGLCLLEYRGYDSAGIALSLPDGILCVRTKGRVADLEKKLSERTPDGNCGIGHTRWATHGEPSDRNAHPHTAGKVTLVHNGIVENDTDLRNDLKKHGCIFRSQTDTETIVQLLSLHYESCKEPLAAIHETLMKIRGTYALGILFADHPGELYAVRKDSPLIIGAGKDENLIASDIQAILEYTRSYILLEEGMVARVTKDQIDLFRSDGSMVMPEILHADWNMCSAGKDGYDHYMRKEIAEQPDVLETELSLRIHDSRIDFSFDGINDAFLSDCKRIHIVACGTAMHAGMVGKYLIERLARIPVTVEAASEFRYRDPVLTCNDFVVVVSQSGETADTLAALRHAKAHNIKNLAIVNVVGSSIAREAQHVIYTHAGPEIAVASTKAFSVQTAVFGMLAVRLAILNGKISDDESIGLTMGLLSLPGAFEKALSLSDVCGRCAQMLQNAASAFFIGRGLDYCFSQEGALKLKEISYIHCEAFAAGELKHGTISLITDGVPVIALATQSDLLEKMIGNIREVKSRGAFVILICGDKMLVPEEIADQIIRVPQMENDHFSALPAIVPLQLLAYHTAVLRGCDVDKPRNLAKSVTVE